MKNQFIALCVLGTLLASSVTPIWAAPGGHEATGTLTTSSESSSSGLSGNVATLVTPATLPTVSTISGTVNNASSVTINSGSAVVFNPVGDIRVTIPASTVILPASGTGFDVSAISTSSTTVSSGLGASEVSNGAIEFGISNIGLNFSKPIKVEIPVTGVTSGTITVKVKHGGTSTFVTTGLTNDPNATCTNGIPSVASNIATVTAGVATIYTCSASTFTAYSTQTSGGSSGGGGGGIVSIVAATGTTTNTGVTVTEVAEDTEETTIESTPSFKDISKSFARSYIETLAELGVVSGFSDGTFRPENSATRAEFIKMVLKGFDISPILDIKKSSFSDVTVSWQIGYIEKAKQMGIIKGQIEGDMRVFRPNENISRAEALKILFGAAKIAVDTSLSSSQFSDVTIAWQIPYVEKAKSLNIVNGQTQDGKLIFRPNASITRAELAKILVKVLEME